MDDQGWAEDYELIFSGKTLLEMTAKGANKGGMVRRLAQRLGISMEHVYCVGDEANDLSMLQAAAPGLCPGQLRPVGPGLRRRPGGRLRRRRHRPGGGLAGPALRRLTDI